MKMAQFCRIFNFPLEQMKGWIKNGVVSADNTTRSSGMSFADMTKCVFISQAKKKGLTIQIIRNFVSVADSEWEKILDYEYLIFKDSENFTFCDNSDDVVEYMLSDQAIGGYHLFGMSGIKKYVIERLANIGIVLDIPVEG